MPVAAWLVSALTAAFGFLVKHPFVAKMMLFSFFVLAVQRFITFVVGLLKPFLVNIPFLNLLCYFGVISALELLFSIVIAGFGAKQVLAFMRTT